jgi:hypothetical protein
MDSLAYFEEILNTARPNLVVVASQHDPRVRALLLLARKRGVASIYFPHAPLARNPQYADVPTDFAGMRGPGEVRTLKTELPEFHEESVWVVGNPAVDGDACPDVDREKPGIMALSNVPSDHIRQEMQMVADAGYGDMVVAPHPAAKIGVIERHLPSGWSLARDNGTRDLLLEGHPYLIQSGSGVALESLALGIPTVELTTGVGFPNYYFIDERYVYFVSTSKELSAIWGSLLDSGAEASKRARWIEWAEYWCAYTGSVAADKALGLLEEADDKGQQADAVLDGWGIEDR